MQPTEALILAELSLRSLIKSVLGTTWAELPGLPSQDTLLDRKRGEAANRPGVEVSSDPLDYVYIKELQKIFHQRRGQFGDVFPDKARFDALIDILASYRNAPFHARSLKWFESDLVTGGSGYIVASITRWRSNRMDDRSTDYPVILSVSDEWGNEFWAGGAPTDMKDVTLEVGQVVHFTCNGSDADDRPLLWDLHVGQPSRLNAARDSSKGSSTTLTWLVGKQDVSPSWTDVYITLSVDDDYPRRESPYECDAFASYPRYIVRRPRALKPPASFL